MDKYHVESVLICRGGSIHKGTVDIEIFQTLEQIADGQPTQYFTIPVSFVHDYDAERCTMTIFHSAETEAFLRAAGAMA